MNPAILEFLKQKVSLRDFSEGPCAEPASVIPRFTGMARGDVRMEDLTASVFRCLARTRQRHVIVAGESGVGKTTFLHHVATRLRQRVGNGSSSDSYQYILYLDVAALCAEESRGFWETLRDLVSSLSGTCLLCLDGLMSVVPRPQGLHNWSLIRGLAQRPEVTLLATVSRSELEQIHADFSFVRDVFDFVTLEEPDEMTVWEMGDLSLDNWKQKTALETSATFLTDTIEACQNFLMNDCFPGKLMILLERCFENKLYEQRIDSARMVAPSPLGKADIATAIQELSGLTLEPLAVCHAGPTLEELLAAEVFGQPEAVSRMAGEIEMYLAGLGDSGKPATVVLLAGTTGVGKTELAKAVCKYYSKSKSLRIFTMGNFTEPHSVSSIIGVPPGYVGHELGGPLVNQLLADPFSVFLLDEAEKAHANVWKPFLNLFDEGWITDQCGRRANAEHAIFILTTNAGDRQVRQLFEQGASYESVTEKVKDALVRYRPERGSQSVFSEQFLARVNEIIVFRPLDRETMQQITQAHLQRLTQRWRKRPGLQLHYSDQLVSLIAEYCFQKDQQSRQREGGRLVRKTVRSRIEVPLLETIRTLPPEELAATTVMIEIQPVETIDELDWSQAVQFQMVPSEADCAEHSRIATANG